MDLADDPEHPKGSWLDRLRYGSFYPDAELVHNLHRLLLFRSSRNTTVYWLNSQARIYIERGGNKYIGFFEEMERLIAELFTLVPESLKDWLQWSGPKVSATTEVAK